MRVRTGRLLHEKPQGRQGWAHVAAALAGACSEPGALATDESIRIRARDRRKPGPGVTKLPLPLPGAAEQIRAPTGARPTFGPRSPLQEDW